VDCCLERLDESNFSNARNLQRLQDIERFGDQNAGSWFELAASDVSRLLSEEIPMPSSISLAPI